jgi:fumarylacetoacetate (FAA) hydrolase
MGSGTVSNKGADGGAGKPVSEGGRGYSCIAEVRMIQQLLKKEPLTPFMSPGDVVRIEMMDGEGHSIFGAIEQKVASA